MLTASRLIKAATLSGGADDFNQFPVVNAFQTSNGSDDDAFVARLKPGAADYTSAPSRR